MNLQDCEEGGEQHLNLQDCEEGGEQNLSLQLKTGKGRSSDACRVDTAAAPSDLRDDPHSAAEVHSSNVEVEDMPFEIGNIIRPLPSIDTDEYFNGAIGMVVDIDFEGDPTIVYFDHHGRQCPDMYNVPAQDFELVPPLQLAMITNFISNRRAENTQLEQHAAESAHTGH